MPDTTVIHQGRRLRLEIEQVPDRDGRRRDYEIVRHPGASVILPWLNEQTVVMIQNERRAAGQTLLELPAGTLDNGEDPQSAAIRELAEETGYRTSRIERLASFFLLPGFCDERLHVFAAYDLTPGETNLDLGERIRVLPMDYAAVLRAIEHGEIIDAKTIATVLFYDRFRNARR